MKIKVVYLGGSRVQSGSPEEIIELPKGATVAEAATHLGERHPDLAPHLGSVRWAINFEFAPINSPLSPNDELALIPPVQGGAPRTVVTEAPLNPEEIRAWVQHPEAGATTSFVGTVRNHSRGEAVVRLEYEAYVPMVERQLELICDKCEALEAGTRVAIGHRYGTLEIGEISVVIAVSAPHRAAAFDACRQAIELIKTDVPIWKKELTENGETWVGWGGG